MFGRKAREEALERVIEAQKEIARLEGELLSMKEMRNRLQAESDERLARVHELEVANAVFKERLDLLTQMPHLTAGPPRDLSMSEEREDLEDALRKGFIDPERFQAELESIGMLNTKIDIAAEDYPQLQA